jgi:hypothetical protein
MKEDEMDEARGRQGTAEKYITGFGEKNFKEKRKLRRTGFKWDNMKYILKK